MASKETSFLIRRSQALRRLNERRLSSGSQLRKSRVASTDAQRQKRETSPKRHRIPRGIADEHCWDDDIDFSLHSRYTGRGMRADSGFFSESDISEVCRSGRETPDSITTLSKDLGQLSMTSLRECNCSGDTGGSAHIELCSGECIQSEHDPDINAAFRPSPVKSRSRPHSAMLEMRPSTPIYTPPPSLPPPRCLSGTYHSRPQCFANRRSSSLPALLQSAYDHVVSDRNDLTRSSKWTSTSQCMIYSAASWYS